MTINLSALQQNKTKKDIGSFFEDPKTSLDTSSLTVRKPVGEFIERAPEPTFGEKIKALIPAPIREGLFGRGQDVDITGQLRFDTGFLGFFRPFGFGKPVEQKASDRIDLLQPLVTEGKITQERANEIIKDIVTPEGIQAIQRGLPVQKPELNLTPDEKEALRPVVIEETLDKIFGILDVTAFGTLKPIEKTIAQKIAKSKSVNEIANFLSKSLPDMTDDAVDVFSRALREIDNADDVQRVLNKTELALQEARKTTGKIKTEALGPVREAPTPKVTPKIQKITESDQFFINKADEIGVNLKVDSIGKLNNEVDSFMRLLRDKPEEGLKILGVSIPKTIGKIGAQVDQLEQGLLELKKVAPEIKTRLVSDVIEEIKPKIERPKELKPLEIEARKYKSADEFVKAQEPINFPIKDILPTEGHTAENTIKLRKPGKDVLIDPIRVEINKQGKIQIQDGNHRFFNSVEKGDKTVPIVFNDQAPLLNFEGEFDRIKDFFDEAKKPKPVLDKRKPISKEPRIERKLEKDVVLEKKAEIEKVVPLKKIIPTDKEISQAKKVVKKTDDMPPANKTITITNDWGGIFELPHETKFEAFRRSVEDFNIRLKVLNNKIEDMSGGKIVEHLNLWAQKDMLPRKQSDILRRLRDEKRDFVEKMVRANVSVEEFDTYLHARHAIERNAQMNKLRVEVGKDPIDGLSGMTNAEANKILAGDNKKFKEFTDIIDKKNSSTLKFQLDEGLLKPKEYEAIKSTYDNYVPLFRDVGEDFTGIGIGQGIDIKGKEIKRAKGSLEKRVVSPVGNVFYQEEKARVRALKNEVGKTVIDLVKKYPDTKNIFEIEAQKYIPKYNSEGELQFLDPRMKLGDNVIGTKIDGKQFFITIKDPKTAQALKNLNTARIPAGLQFLRSALGIWSSFKTRWRPEFLITNFQRDLGEALLNLGVEKTMLKEQGKRLRIDIIKDLFPSQKAIWKYLRGGDDAQVDEFFKLGGDAGHFWLEDVSKAEKSLKQLEKEVQNFGVEKIKNPIRKIGQLADDINSMVELGVRFSTYKNLTSRGFNTEQAIQSSADLTVNFSRQGELSPVLKSIYGFINPTIQGGSKVIRSLSSKEGGKSVARGVVFLTSLGFFTRYMSMMIDEEGDEQISDWNKNHKLTFAIGNGNTINLWNMPYGFTLFYALGSNMAELLAKKKTGGEVLRNVYTTTVDSFSPFGTSLNDMIPTLAKPIFDVNQNKAWYDGKIHPDQVFTKTPKPNVSSYFSSASETSKFITAFINDVSGGDTKNDKAGLLDLHPNDLDYLFDQYFGGPFEFVQTSIEAGARGFNGEFEPNKTPFVRQFYREGRPQQFAYSVIYDTLERAYKKDLSDLETNRFYRAVDLGLEEEVFDQVRADGYVKDFIKAQYKITGSITDNVEKIQAMPEEDRERLINTYAETTQKKLRKKQPAKKSDLSSIFGESKTNSLEEIFK